MPIYEYECRSCNHRFEIRQSFHDEPKAACPKCSEDAKRIFQPAPIIFKGSGFYVTDHRSPGPSAPSSSGKSSDSGTSSSSSTSSETSKSST